MAAINEYYDKLEENDAKIRESKNAIADNNAKKKANKKMGVDILDDNEKEEIKNSISTTDEKGKEKSARKLEKEIAKATKNAAKEKTTKLNYELEAKNKDEKQNIKDANKSNAQATRDMYLAGSGVKIAGLTGEDNKSELDDLTETKKDIANFKEVAESTKKEMLDKSKTDAQEQYESMKALVDEMGKGDISYSIADLPKGIVASAKRGDFGKFNIDEKIKQAYFDEMKKPIKERNQEIIDKYKAEKESSKGARQTMGYFLLDHIFKSLQNVGNALQGKEANAISDFKKMQNSKLESSLHRYNEMQEKKAKEMQKIFENKGILDKRIQEQIAELYKNAQFRPYLEKLDADSMEKVLLRTKALGGKIDLQTFKNALILQMLENPEGAIMGAAKTAINLVPGAGAVTK